MGRLNQSGRQKIGYVYKSQVQNDVSIQPPTRQMFEVINQSFDQNMKGDGIGDTMREIFRGQKPTGQAIQRAVQGIKFADPVVVKQIHNALPQTTKDNINMAINKLSPDPKVINTLNQIRKRKGDISKVIKGSGTSIQPSVGGGLGLAGAGPIILPGDKLRKKLLSKMVRERKMKSLGDRKKTSPVKQGMNGGSLVIPGKGRGGSPGGQSASKTYPGMKGYKLNPKPLVGGGPGNVSPNVIIEYLKKNAIPALKKEGLISESVVNSEKIKQLVELHAKKAIDVLKDPLKIIKTVLNKLKPIMKGKGLGLAGSGIGETINRLGWKLLAGIFRIGNPNSPFAKAASHVGRGKKRRKKKRRQRGGFIFSLAAIIAAISGAASAAAAAASAVGAISIAGTTVGALTGAALTGAAGATGAALVGKAIGGKGMKGKGVKEFVKGVIHKTKLTINDLPTKDKIKLKEGFEALKKNPTKEGIIALGKKMAPAARNAMINKVNKVLKKTKTGISLKGSGNGNNKCGSGLGLAGAGAKKFNKDFVKAFTKKLTT
jgi:hypothetical protein